MTLVILAVVALQAPNAEHPKDVASRPADQAIDGVIGWINRYRAIPNLSVTFRMEYEPLDVAPRYAYSISKVRTLRQGEKIKTVATLTEAKSGRVDIRQTAFDGQEAMHQVLSERLASDIGVSKHLHAWFFTYRTFDDFIFSPEGNGRYRELYSKEPLANSDYWLPFALERLRSHFRIIDEESSVNGAKCIILDRDNLDRLWIAPEDGYAVHRREIRQQAEGPLLERTDLSDFHLVDGVELPHRLIREEYGELTDVPEVRGRLIGRKTVTVEEISSGKIEESEFALPITPGTRVIDNIRQKIYLRIAPGEDRIEQAKDSIKPRSNVSLLIILNVIAIAIIAGVIWYRRRRANRSG